MNVLNKKKSFRFFAMILVCVTFLSIMTPTQVFATGSSGSGGSSSSGSNDEVETVGDIYDVTTALTAYVNNVVGANSNDKHNNQRVENPQKMGNAGAYVGYGDEKKQKFEGFITNNTTVGASTSTYDAWKNIIDGGGKNYAYQYVRLGKLLADEGLDETFEPSANQNGRTVKGIITRAAYGASELVPTAFGFTLKILNKLNPFAFFKVSNVEFADNKTGQMLSPLRDWISGIYTTITEKVTWMATIPLLLALSIFSVLMLRKKAGKTFGVMAFRIIFIVGGIPMLGALYTTSLADLTNVTSEDPTGARLVASSYVDFASWADNGLPMRTDYGTSTLSTDEGSSNAGGTPTADSLKKLRSNAGKINKSNSPAFAGLSVLGTRDVDKLSGGEWNDNNGKVTHENAEESKLQSGINDMLDRYQKAESYTASAYASKVSQSLEDTPGESMLKNMFDTTDEMGDWMKRKTNDNEAIWKGTAASADAGMDWITKGKSRSNIFKNGTMQANGGADTLTYNGKLSTLSMYNYLSTSFGSSSIVTYSNSTSISEHTQQVHASVTAVGSGLLELMFNLNMWACLGVTAVLGVFFAIATLFDGLKTTVKLLTSIPFSAFGIIKSIAQVIIYTIMLILQIVVGAFMYSFIAEMALVFASFIEQLVSGGSGGLGITDYTNTFVGGRFIDWMTNVSPSALSNSMVSAYLMVGFEFVAVLFFGYAVMKYRRAIVRVYAVSLEKAFELVTCSEFQDELHRIWHGGRVGLSMPDTNGLHEVFNFLKPEQNLDLVRG